MLKRKIPKKYKDWLQLAIIIAVLASYAYYEDHKKDIPQLSHIRLEKITFSPVQP